MAHEHEVTGLIPAGVQGMMVDMAKDGTRADTVCAVLGIDVLAQSLHQHSWVLTFIFCLILVRLGCDIGGGKAKTMALNSSGFSNQRRECTQPHPRLPEFPFLLHLRKSQGMSDLPSSPVRHAEDWQISLPCDTQPSTHLRGALREGKLPLMGLIIKLIVGVENAPQVDATDLLSGALLFQVALHTINDGTHLRFILQVLYVLWQGEHSSLAQPGTQAFPDISPWSIQLPLYKFCAPIRKVYSLCPKNTILSWNTPLSVPPVRCSLLLIPPLINSPSSSFQSHLEWPLLRDVFFNHLKQAVQPAAQDSFKRSQLNANL